MKSLRSMNWLWIAGAFTIAYLSLMTWWIGLTTLRVFASNTKLNEIGDFLSGTFAPLAFVWLLAAVVTQRQELDETRSQFVENQRIVDEQLETIASQNKLLKDQHNQAETTAKQNYRLSLFDQRFSIYNEVLAIRHRIESSGDITADDWEASKGISEKSYFLFGSFAHDYLSDVADEIFEYLQFISDNYGALLEDPDGTGFLYNERKQQAIQNDATSMRLNILRKMSRDSLRVVMHSSMTVSDEK